MGNQKGYQGGEVSPPPPQTPQRAMPPLPKRCPKARPVNAERRVTLPRQRKLVYNRYRLPIRVDGAAAAARDLIQLKEDMNDVTAALRPCEAGLKAIRSSLAKLRCPFGQTAGSAPSTRSTADDARDFCSSRLDAMDDLERQEERSHCANFHRTKVQRLMLRGQEDSDLVSQQARVRENWQRISGRPAVTAIGGYAQPPPTDSVLKRLLNPFAVELPHCTAPSPLSCSAIGEMDGCCDRLDRRGTHSVPSFSSPLSPEGMTLSGHHPGSSSQYAQPLTGPFASTETSPLVGSPDAQLFSPHGPYPPRPQRYQHPILPVEHCAPEWHVVPASALAPTVAFRSHSPLPAGRAPAHGDPYDGGHLHFSPLSPPRDASPPRRTACGNCDT